MAGPTPAEHARELLRLEQNEHVEYRKADPSIFAKNQIRGDKWWSIAEEYAESGYDLEPGDNAMRASLDRCGADGVQRSAAPTGSTAGWFAPRRGSWGGDWGHWRGDRR